MSLARKLDNFVKSGRKFSIVYNSLESPRLSRILVLDSSFNPPHLAHYALAQEAIEYDFGSEDKVRKDGPGGWEPGTNKRDGKSLLLLLSVNNADKIVPEPASFAQRLDMMHLTATALEKLNIKVSIGLTTHAKFADKALAIQEHLDGITSRVEPMHITFLLGFDTLLRVLDPKYYFPVPLSKALDKFMANCDLFCLTRADDMAGCVNQYGYVDRIASGCFPDIPPSWANKIVLKTVNSTRIAEGAISSSSIRKAYSSGIFKSIPVLPQVDNYIRENRLYSKDES